MNPEGVIQNAIELALGALPGVLVLRNSVGTATHINKKSGRTYRVSYGLGEGSPDLLVLLAPDGRALGLEVKVPGENAEPHQEKCHAQWRYFGVHVEVVHSVDEARAALTRASEGSK